MKVCDAHCHFFSHDFFRALGREAAVDGEAAELLPSRLGWEPPGTTEALADRWVTDLDRHGVARALLMASVPGDEASIVAAVGRHPTRLLGAFMFNPAAGDVTTRLDRAFEHEALRTVCLFPAMHLYALDDTVAAAVFAAALRHKRAVFVHCGVLSVGVRAKLGLASRFDLRLGDPLAVSKLAVRYPGVPTVIPHFGAGPFSRTLMAADQAPNLLLDTSSSNGWIKFHVGRTLRDVFARALDCVGPERLLFGTDSSFFPRGWQQPIADAQRAVLDDLGVSPDDQAQIFGGNFQRLYPERA